MFRWVVVITALIISRTFNDDRQSIPLTAGTHSSRAIHRHSHPGLIVAWNHINICEEAKTHQNHPYSRNGCIKMPRDLQNWSPVGKKTQTFLFSILFVAFLPLLWLDSTLLTQSEVGERCGDRIGKGLWFGTQICYMSVHWPLGYL